MRTYFLPAVMLATAALLSGGSPATATPPPQASLRSLHIWAPPLGPPLRVATPYALPNGPYQAGHRGIDLPAPVGAAVRSPATGTVSYVGYVVDRPVLSVRVDARTVVSFEPIESELSEGQAVGRGDVIGEVGSVKKADSVEQADDVDVPGASEALGAHCRAECLHLGVRVDGEYVNPLRFLRARPVLLPW